MEVVRFFLDNFKLPPHYFGKHPLLPKPIKIIPFITLSVRAGDGLGRTRFVKMQPNQLLNEFK